MNIKELVKDNKMAKIVYYKLGQLWYELENGFRFPVPVGDTEEIGDAVFKVEEKALLLMRYIRKHIKYLEEANANWEIKLNEGSVNDN